MYTVHVHIYVLQSHITISYPESVFDGCEFPCGVLELTEVVGL
jgi:hypothetical protein